MLRVASEGRWKFPKAIRARKQRWRIWRIVMLVVVTFSVSACAGFRRLSSDLELMEETYLLSGGITNAPEIEGEIWIVVIERMPSGKTVSGDIARAGKLGAYAFALRGKDNRYVYAFTDRNGDGVYTPGEPAWVHADSTGVPVPITFPPEERITRLRGALSTRITIPSDLIESARAFRNGQPLEEVITGWGIEVSLGELAELDEPRFSAERGEEGLWEPASFPIQSGVGIFFLEPYDAKRTPVLFVYGIMGSPQNWKSFFDTLDRDRYQPWFYFYPTGRRIEEMADWLNRGIDALHDHYRFKRLHVVAHSMGGLVSRAFLLENILEGHNQYIDRFITISTPWGGHAAAKAGVEQAPSVVPSWRDLAPGSEFLDSLFDESLKGHVDYHLLFGYRGSRSLILPPSNDGTVSVASELRPEAQAEASRLYGFDASHSEILSDPAVIETVESILDARQGH